MCPYCGLEVEDVLKHAKARHGISTDDMLEHMVNAQTSEPEQIIEHLIHKHGMDQGQFFGLWVLSGGHSEHCDDE